MNKIDLVIHICQMFNGYENALQFLDYCIFVTACFVGSCVISLAQIYYKERGF